MRKILHLLSILLTISILFCGCTADPYVRIQQKIWKSRWYSEELDMTLEKDCFVLCTYEGKEYTLEDYDWSKWDIEETYCVIQYHMRNKLINIYADVYAYDSKKTHSNEHYAYIPPYWEEVIGDLSGFLLRGRWEYKKDHLLLAIEEDNLYNGKYTGQTIRFDKIS